jgi:type IV pilus assembly protein PilQ
MKVAALERRESRRAMVSLVSALLLVGSICPTVAFAGATEGSAEASSELSEGRARMADMAPILREGVEKFAISHQVAGGMETITVETGLTDPKVESLKLSKPERLVFDVNNLNVRAARSIPVVNSNLVSAVRVASRGNKGRIVLDLRPGAISHQLETQGGTLQISLNGTDVVSDRGTQVGALPSITTKEDTDTSFREEESLTRKIDAADLKLLGVSLTAVGAEGEEVVAKLSSPADFTLKQTAPSEYVLTLRKADISQEAIGTVISPSQTSLIRSVRPTSEGDDVLLRIFAKPHANLSADLEGSSIVIRSSLTPLDDDSRAQMAPESPAEKNPVGAAPPAAPPAAAVNTPAPEATKEAVTTSSDTSSAAAAGADGDFAKFLDDSPKYAGRLISLDLQDTDIDNALRIIAEVSNLNIIASDDVTGKVTLRLIDVPWDQALDVILKTNNLDKVQEGNVIRIAPVEKLRAEREALKQARQAEEELEPLQVKYLRVSYSKASELKSLLDSVISERGNVAYDERTNQLIVKDIGRGIKNAIQLISKTDLRTPQVLLETQIVESTRGLLRQLGAEFGYRFVQSPETGNATGKNFPNSLDFASTIANSVGANPISLILGSADGSKSLSAVLTQQENEGRARVISRPAVATTNNKAATIKSVEKIRVRLPDSGVSVATGQGAQASGGSRTATETIEVGIVLEVTPQASPDYYVLLDVKAKSSTLGASATDGIPNEIERSANSTVLVSSGQTFALGGIYKISENDAVQGLPWFKDIPFFGTLFRSVSTRGSDEELLFFITPRIVEGSFDDAAMKSSL